MAKGSHPYSAVGKNFLRYRMLRRLTQEKAAERIGISLKYYQALEAGSKAPAFDTLCRVKKVMECSWSQLLNGC